MGLVDRYKSLADLPGQLPLFPLARVLLLPRAQLPLNIFEPRYLAMIDAAMAGGRIIGMVQPARGQSEAGKPALAEVGTAGRVTAYSEADDGRYLITLTGIARFRVVEEADVDTPFRAARVDFAPYLSDLEGGRGEQEVDRERLIDTLDAYLAARNLDIDWDDVHASSTESLVNALSMLSPYGSDEKQALLEAPDLAARAEILIALTEMDIGARRGDDGVRLQ